MLGDVALEVSSSKNRPEMERTTEEKRKTVESRMSYFKN